MSCRYFSKVVGNTWNRQMAQAKIPDNENARLRALYSYDLLDRDCDEIFETIIKTAADVCDVDISVIALIDQDRQFFFARNGMKPRETPRAIAFCAHAILEPHETFEVENAPLDPRFADNPLVTGEIGVRFYAAQPLTTKDGLAIGGLCLIGRQPKKLNVTQRRTLQRLASVIMALFEDRKSAAAADKMLHKAGDTAKEALADLQAKKAALRAQNEHFNAALDNMTQGLCMFDADQRLIVCNRQYGAMYSLPDHLTQRGTLLDDIVRHRISIGIFAGATPEDYTRERTDWATNVRAETAVHEMSDGRVIFLARRPMKNGGWVATHEDITGLSRAQTELEALNAKLAMEEERFRKLYRNTPTMMHSINEDGVIVETSEYWLEVMGYASEEVIGRKSTEFMTEASRDFAVNIVLPQFWKDGHCKDVPYQFMKKDGTVIDVKLSAIIDTEVGTETRRTLACLVDVTDQLRAEQALIDHRDRLQQAVYSATADLKAQAQELELALAREKELNELQRQFVSMASHEFRTPLAIIDGTAQRLIRNTGQWSQEETLQRVEKIRGAVQRMTRLMESTLTAARMDDGKVAVDLRPCDIGALVASVCERQQEISSDHRINHRTENLPKTIEADAGALDQILTNLVSNAVKYSPDDPDIEVTACCHDNHVVITVRDHGLGIDEDDLPKMFTRFFRARTSAGIAGTGIGLNVVKTLTEMHGGTVSVESAKGRGSMFTVRLPISRPETQEKPDDDDLDILIA